MARKITYFEVTNDKSRDYEKKFKIEEMGAFQAEKWCYKIISALIKADIEIPISALEFPAEELALKTFGYILSLDYFTLEPLLNELLDCVQFLAIPNDLNGYRKINKIDDIEDVETLTSLRLEVFKAHLGFLKAVLAPVFHRYQETQNLEGKN